MTTVSDPTPAGLAALLCARLCHDLISALSAVGAALSVLDDAAAADMRDDAVALIRSGARQAQAKLEYARLAYGAGSSRPGVVDLNEARRLAEALLADHKAQLVWRTAPEALDKPAARLLLNLILLAVDAIPRGGTVTIEVHSGAGGSRLRLVSQGPKARLDPIAAAALDGQAPAEGFDGRSIQPYYAGVIAREAGGRASALAEADRVEFTALTAPQAQAAA